MIGTLKDKTYLQYLLFVAVATVWIGLIAVLPDFFDNPTHGVRGVLTIVCYVVAISLLSFLLLYAAGLNKYVTAVFYPIYGIIGAGVSYYRVAYRVTVTPLILDCVFHTNMQEAASVLSWQMILWIAVNACISIGLVVWRWRLEAPKYAYIHALVAILLFVGYYHCNSRLHRSLNQRYPMNIVESLRLYHSINQSRKAKRTIPAYRCSETMADTLDIVLVIGESMRADHLQLNGYERETTPLLAKRKNIVSMPHIFSEYTHTLASVPVILTRADSLHPEYQYTETSFAAILHQEEYHTAWISNQDMGETFSHFPAECDTMIWANAGKSTYVFSGWYDEALLPYLDQQLSLGNPRNALILHTIGSHWYYNNHVTETYNHYLPITDNRVVTNNSQEQVVNSYDNTVRYLDFFLDSVIQRLENRCAIVFYLSDHGESLGENGNYLHAAGAEETKHPACVIWYSDSYAERYPQNIQALLANHLRRYRTDFLFPSLLSTAGITLTDSTSAENIFVKGTDFQ